MSYCFLQVIAAQKMDRLEYSNRCRMQFIRVLAENNREKEKAITNYPDRLGNVCEKGLREAEKVFQTMADEHEHKLHSIPKRIQVVHDFCVKTEVQAAHGMLKEEDLAPLPKPGQKLLAEVNFDPISPTYREFVDGTEMKVREWTDGDGAVEGEVRDPVMSCTLIRPYLPCEAVKQERRELKAKAVETLKEKKRAEKAKKRSESAKKSKRELLIRRELDEVDALKVQMAEGAKALEKGKAALSLNTTGSTAPSPKNATASPLPSPKKSIMLPPVPESPKSGSPKNATGRNTTIKTVTTMKSSNATNLDMTLDNSTMKTNVTIKSG